MTSPVQGAHFEHKTVAHLIYTKRFKKKKEVTVREKEQKQVDFNYCHQSLQDPCGQMI